MRLSVLIAAAAAAAVTGAAHASSTTSSAASDSASSATSSASDSLQGSSNSSTPDNDRRAYVGDWRVAAIVGVDGRPDRVRLQLEAVDAGAARTVALELPQVVAERAGVHAGARIAARDRPYGLELALADSAPFFLVVDDAVYDELSTRRLTL